MNKKMKIKKQIPIFFSICMSIAILAVLMFVMATLPVASAADWSYRKPITINGSQVQGTVTNFPVLINITDTDLKNHAQNDGGDIVFTNAANTVRYDHEIEKFVTSTGELVAWVEIDSLSAGSDKDIYMWYGNPTCANQWHIEATWDEGGSNNYKLVQHLQEDPANTDPAFKDSTSSNNDGTDYGAITSSDQITGKIDGSLDFDKTEHDYVRVDGSSSLDLTTTITIEAWVKHKSVSDIPDKIFHYRRTGTSGGLAAYQFRFGNAAGNNGKRLIFQTNTATAGWQHAYSNSDVIIDTDWHYYAATASGGTVVLYLDGEVIASTGGVAATFDDGDRGYIGARVESNEYIDASFDELRISASVRSGDWISTTYNNLHSPSTFYTVGSEDYVYPAQPVPDLPAIILFGAGLLVIVLYAVPRRRSRR